MKNLNRSEKISKKEAFESDFLRQVSYFADYQRKEIECNGSRKAFLIIAIDSDASDSDSCGSLCTSIAVGNKEDLRCAIINTLETESATQKELLEAMTAVSLKAIISDIINISHKD